MFNRHAIAAVAVAALVSAGSAAARADGPPAGTYANAKVRLELRPAGDGRYAGRLSLKGQTYPLRGEADGSAIRGTFVSDGQAYPVRIEPREDGGVTLTSGANTFALSPVAAGPARADADAPPANRGGLPEGYTVVKTTDAGRALAARKPGVTRVADALRGTLDDVFGNGYRVTGAYQDQRDRRSGVASATARVGGAPVKAFVSAKLTDAGATVAVLYCRADATRADWAALSAGGGGGGGGGDPAAMIAHVRLREYRFPDNTGLVGLPEGYTTNAQSCQNGFVVRGPSGQMITFGAACAVNTPNSTAVQMARQYGTFGHPLVVSPWCDPVRAMATLVPQFSRISQQQGQPGIEVDHLQPLARVEASLPNSQAAVVGFGLTTADPGERPRHYQGIAQVMCSPLTNESWMYWTTSARAPDESAQRDMPVLIATINSWRTNDQQVMANANAWCAASNRAFAAQQQAARTAREGGEDYIHAHDANWTRQARAMDDFDESIRGWTDVEDTRTGERTTVDLGNVDDIVDALNKVDPERYVHIPLKDDVDPLPGGGSGR